MTKVMAGMDLHSNNVMIGIVDEEGKRIGHKKVDCNLSEVAAFLEPYKKRLAKVAVESTYNWYWLVDGLEALGYPMVLANPAKIEQYSGLKHGDDKGDAYHLADLLRLGILPEAYIYDKDLRPVRDLLRRRMSLVQHRTAFMLSFKSLYTRTTGQAMALSELKSMEVKKAQELTNTRPIS
jgi:transposase